jgi:8-oxo-dGTP pyrophosphatase MutT (NUDIX family)
MTQHVTHPQAHDDEPFLRSLSGRLRPLEGWGAFRQAARRAAVTAILYRREGEWHIPFVLRRADLRSHPGQVGLPGGGVQAGEDAWTAAAREAEEEIGVPAAGLVPLGAGVPVYAEISNYSVVPFVAWLASPPEAFVAEPGELEAVFEVPLKRLLDGAAWRRPGAFPGPHLPVGDTMIWGLTARLLDGVLPPIEAALRES